MYVLKKIFKELKRKHHQHLGDKKKGRGQERSQRVKRRDKTVSCTEESLTASRSFFAATKM